MLYFRCSININAILLVVKFKGVNEMSAYIEKVESFLADQIVMYIKIHNLHWNVKGANFFSLHSKFEELYDETSDILDEVAERLLALEKQPCSSLSDALKKTSISERVQTSPIEGKEAVEILLKDYEILAYKANEIIDMADKDGDEGTADDFTGYLKTYQKNIWMLKTVLK